MMDDGWWRWRSRRRRIADFKEPLVYCLESYIAWMRFQKEGEKRLGRRGGGGRSVFVTAGTETKGKSFWSVLILGQSVQLRARDESCTSNQASVKPLDQL